MIPWVDIPGIAIGGWTVQPYVLFVAAAVLVGRWAFVKAATARGFPSDMSKAFYATVVLAAALAGPITKFAREPALLGSDPRIWLGFIVASSSWIGIAAGVATALALARYGRLTRSQCWLLCDSFAWAFPFGWLIARLGCAWTHHHPGIASTGFLAVQYPGRSRYDLAFLEALLCAALVLLWTAVRKRQSREGSVSGLVLVAVGAFRIAANGVRLDRATALDFWEVAAPAALLVLGVAVLAYAMRGRGVRERQSRLERAVA